MARKQSKHLVSVIDVNKFGKQGAIDYLTTKGLLMDNQSVETATLGIVEKNGLHYALNTEGVGDTAILEEEGLIVEWYRETRKDNVVTNCDCFPCLQSTFNMDEVNEMLKDAPKIPLDVFIRVRNNRLEKNFELWEGFLND